MAGFKKHNHTVSRGYLRHFAEQRPGRGGKGTPHFIRLVFKDGRPATTVSVADAFTRRNFSSFTVKGQRHDGVEDEWMRVETECLPAIRAVRGGDRSGQSLWKIRVVMALHLARSVQFETVHRRVAADVRASYSPEVAGEAELARLFQAQHGRPAAAGELTNVIQDHFDELLATNRLQVERMVEIYNDILEYLAPLQLHVGRTISRRVPLVTSDAPVVLAKRNQPAAGLQSGIAIKEAHEISMPLGPDTLVALATAPMPEIVLDTVETRLRNNLMWRNAINVVGCHPAADWRNLCLLSTQQPG